MSSNNNSIFSSLGSLGPVLDLLGKALGPALSEAFNQRAGKSQPAGNAEVQEIVGNILQALSARPTAGSWHVHHTLGAEGTAYQVRAGEMAVTGPAMTEADARYIAAVNPELLSKLLIWHAAREEAKAEAAKYEVSAATLEKLHSGDRLSDQEIVGLVQHFRKLDPLLASLGPTWRLASDAARRELVRVEDLLRARNLSV